MVSIVIVNWNSGPLLRECVLSLDACAHGCEIVIVDNASQDSSLDFELPGGSRAEIIRNDRNLGFAAGNNLGWRKSSGEQVLFLNPDTECRPDAVGQLAKTLADNPSHWAVGGQLIDGSGRAQVGFNVRSFPTIGSVTAEMILLDEVWPANPWSRRYRMSDWDHRSFRYVDQPAGACLMVRRDVLESLRGFDERFHPAWFEDVDLCRRIRSAGGLIAYQPSARFLHHGGASLRALPQREFLEYFHTNQCRYFAKHHGESAAARVRRRVVAGMYVRAALSLIYPTTRPSRLEAARTYWRTARYFRQPRACRP
jgi:GT2 family glycosyltransferase